MPQVIASAVLANGLRTEFADTYEKIKNRQADSRLSMVMDLGIGATNRQHEFAYFEAAPHVEYWPIGSAIPEDTMGSVQWTTPVFNWGRRVPWSKWDRKDDQTQSLYDLARMAGESAALLPERFFFDLVSEGTTTLPTTAASRLAPDGVVFFSTTNGAGTARFGITSGNLLTGTGLGSISTVTADYYNAIEQFMLFQDGKGQPLLSPETIASGTVIVHAAADTQIMEQAFLQTRQGVVYGSNTAASTPTNIIQEANRNVMLFASPRLATGDWYVFLRNPPKLATYLLDREGVIELSSLEGDNNSDSTRTYGLEYVQWERRAGAGVALPYAAIKINN